MATLTGPIALIHTEAEHLAQYLAALSPAAWCQPSACAGWEVRDVVAHLIQVGQFYQRVITRGLQGETEPPPEFPPPETDPATFIAQNAITARQQLGERLLPTLRAVYAQLTTLLAQLDAGAWEHLCYYASAPHSRPVREFLALSVQELALHSWDIRFPNAPGVRLSPESLAVLVQHQPRRLDRPRRRVFPLPPGHSEPVRWRWQLSGAVPGEHDMLVEQGRCRMELASPAPAQVTFRAEPRRLS